VSFEERILGPGEGREIWQLGNEMQIKAGGDTTNGAYTLLEQTCGGAPPPLHVHDREEEAFYVLEGMLDIQMGDRTLQAGPGAFCLVPRGTAHTFHSTSDTPARILVIVSPPGFERFFEQCEDHFPRSAGMPGPEEVGPVLGELASRHGLRILGPPPA
jgi:mannose-6-phosphate isomerase-like protein (cupin superfamily)